MLILEGCWNIHPKERPPFAEILNDLHAMQSSVRLHDEESFAALQLEWKDEVEEEMETIRSESVNTMVISMFHFVCHFCGHY